MNNTVVIVIFWISFGGVIYAYFGYPLLLMIMGRFIGRKNNLVGNDAAYKPSISVVIPVHNEEAIIGNKLENIKSLDYPAEKCEIIIVSDGSTDRTGEIVSQHRSERIKYIQMSQRRGKAAALNAGVEKAVNEIIVFSDASIMLRQDALRNIVQGFRNPEIGCISGEDHILVPGGEGIYGRYELFLRNQESEVYSIVGASGSFYAQRRSLTRPFQEGMAPDFLSVLDTVEKGYRAITEPKAVGIMTSVKSTKGEFDRKVRTLIRGMAALFHKKRLLNPFRYGIFAFELLSHKIMRWLVPFFLIALFCSNLFLLGATVYEIIFMLQVVFYLLVVLSLASVRDLQKRMMGKIPLYFITVNTAILFAWYKYLTGVRQEIWNPTKRQI